MVALIIRLRLEDFQTLHSRCITFYLFLFPFPRHSHSVESLPISKITENPFVLRDNRKKTETKSTNSLAKKSSTKTETKSTNSLNRSTKEQEKSTNSLNRSTKKEEKSSTKSSNLLRRFSVNIGRNEEKTISNQKQEIYQIDPVRKIY